MDPNTIFFVIFMGAVLGVVLGFMVTGEGYGWLFNAVAGGFGAVAGAQLLTGTGIDSGPIFNAGMMACASSGLTAMLLRT